MRNITQIFIQPEEVGRTQIYEPAGEERLA